MRLHLEHVRCHDDECVMAARCQRWTERMTRLWARHCLSLRAAGSMGEGCPDYLEMNGDEPKPSVSTETK